MQSVTLPEERSVVVASFLTPLSIAFFLSALVSALAAHLGHEAVAIGTKPIPLLILLYEVGRPLLHGDRSRMRRWLWAGLAFSLVGDMIILASFLGQVGAFFVAHVCYLLAMGWERERPLVQAAAFVPAAALWIGMYGILADAVPPGLYWPVVAYLTVIALMWGRATVRAFVTRGHAWSWLFWSGACLFVLSDSFIALNKRVTPIPAERLAILGTYWVGQWLISRGISPSRLSADSEGTPSAPPPTPRSPTAPGEA